MGSRIGRPERPAGLAILVTLAVAQLVGVLTVAGGVWLAVKYGTW